MPLVKGARHESNRVVQASRVLQQGGNVVKEDAFARKVRDFPNLRAQSVHDARLSFHGSDYTVPTVSAQDAAAVVDERTVVRLWERQAFDPDALKILGLTVVFRGLPSDAGGPDYQDAVLSPGGGRILSGDIEFHVDGDDWYTHRHHLNPRYDNVILHVVWRAGRQPARTSAGRELPTLVLSDAVSQATFQPARPLLVHPCVGAFSRLSGAEIEDRIHRAGLLRLQERADHLAAEVSASTSNQAIYSGLLQACGYASNREAFRKLADAVPFDWLMSLPTGRRAPVLLEAAGFSADRSGETPVHLPADMWRLQRLRPQNHPERRLRGIALLLERLGSSPDEALISAVAEATRPSQLRRLLVVRDDGRALIGSGRADEIVVSVVLPFAMNAVPDAARSLFCRYPAPPQNRWTRLMEGLLEGAGHTFRARRAPEHQGLHWLYHGFCRSEGRAGCIVCGAPEHSLPLPPG